MVTRVEHIESQFFELQVLIDGAPAMEYQKNDLIYIEGKKNKEFTLRIRNNQLIRVLAVATIDGLSIMDGKPGSFDSNGYVLKSNETIDIPGWRLDMHKVAKFIFKDRSKSYAASKGETDNIGVIGCAFFNEKIVYPYPYTITFSNNVLRGARVPGTSIGPIYDGPICNYGDSVYINSIGTGFGESESHAVINVSFTKASAKPNSIININYNDRKALQALGIKFDTKAKKNKSPKSFPANENEFCDPPSGWNR